MSIYEQLDDQEIVRSLAYFNSPSSYVAIETTKDGKLVRDCIERRRTLKIDERGQRVGKRILTASQSPGGQVGYGLDEALVQTIECQGNEVVGTDIGILEDIRIYGDRVVGDVHDDCLYVHTLDRSTAEQANPSDQTKHNFERSLERLDSLYLPGVSDDIEVYLPDLSEAADRQHEFILSRGGGDGLIELAGESTQEYPNHSAVQNTGQPVAWINNYSIDKSLDRNTKHNFLHLRGQAYHNSIAASVMELSTAPGVRGQRLGQRVCALLLRFAAVETIILEANPHLVQLEVLPDGQGDLRVSEQETA